jgi:hypothetical protein
VGRAQASPRARDRTASGVRARSQQERSDTATLTLGAVSSATEERPQQAPLAGHHTRPLFRLAASQRCTRGWRGRRISACLRGFGVGEPSGGSGRRRDRRGRRADRGRDRGSPPRRLVPGRRARQRPAGDLRRGPHPRRVVVGRTTAANQAADGTWRPRSPGDSRTS